MANMQMLNFNNILNVKDSRWLQLEVCREFQRNKCTRPDTECKFAHPPVNVEVQNGRVTACYDSIKGRCNREKPPCKYFHPPQHLKDQLLINGRNHLALKNAFMTQIQGLSPGTQLVHGTLPVHQQASSPYLTSIPTMANFNPYITSSPVMTVGMTDSVGSPLTGVVPQGVVPAQKVPRPDRLENAFFRWQCPSATAYCQENAILGPIDEGKHYVPKPLLHDSHLGFAGMGVVPYKRPAPEKSGMPVYQPASNAAYQQALMQQLGGQSYVPVSCEYGGSTSTLLALPPPSNADASTHSPPAIYNAASSTQLETPSSSTSSTTSSASYTPSSTTLSSTSYSLTTNTPPSSTSGKTNSLHVINSRASPSLPPTPMNILSYAGYSLNKGVRPHAKPTATSQYVNAPSTVPGGIHPTYSPGIYSHTGISNMGYGLGMPPVSIGYQMPSGLTMMPPHQGVASGLGGLVQAGMPMMPNIGAVGNGMSSVLSPQLVYSQYPSSSVYLPPQLSALSSNQQISWAQAGEQPYKKLKTS